jgi:hypothetical protein
MSMYRSDRRPSSYSLARNAPAPQARGPVAAPESVNRRIGTGSIGIQRAQGDGPTGPRNAEFRRGRDSELRDHLGFDRRGTNDGGITAASLGIRY